MYFFVTDRHYCDNDTTSQKMMLEDKRCPAGKYCVEGLASLNDAANCTKGKYCLEGELQ